MYRVVLRHWRFLHWTGPIFDFAFWIFSFFLVFASLMWANQGDLRIYIFVVLGIGLVLYRIFLRRVVVGSTIGIIMGIHFLTLQLYRGFLLIVVRPVKVLFRLLISLLRVADRILRKLEKLILWPFQPLSKLLGWILRKILQLIALAARPLVYLLEPYAKPIIQRIAPKLKPIYRRVRRFLKQGKGIWHKLTNWLLNRDDHNPKP